MDDASRVESRLGDDFAGHADDVAARADDAAAHADDVASHGDEASQGATDSGSGDLTPEPVRREDAWKGIDRFPEGWSSELSPAGAGAPEGWQAIVIRDGDGLEVVSRTIPPTPAAVQDLAAGGLTEELWARTYVEATHNMEEAQRATLGSYVHESPESYTAKAQAAGDAYFSYDEWGKFQERYGTVGADGTLAKVSEEAMYDLFNKPFLDDIDARGLGVRFTHDPRVFGFTDDGIIRALGKEYEDLLSRRLTGGDGDAPAYSGLESSGIEWEMRRA